MKDVLYEVRCLKSNEDMNEDMNTKYRLQLI